MISSVARRPSLGPSILVLLLFLCFTLAIGFLGGQVTAPHIPSWYAFLNKPSFNPPNGVFMPVWTALYALMAAAAWRAWRKEGWGNFALGLWFIQLGLNFAWSFLFFGAHALLPAFIEIVLLWVAILFTLIAFWRIEALAGLLMVPYLAWVSFAGVLNFWIWRLNP